ncbi:MAG: phosphopantetheine-binding protein [Desulfobacterales bacterium]|nr:phosphopantetheine-binding protein [Desulfobacterales bacterium]
MTENYTDEKIFLTIRDIVAQALRVDITRIEMEARIFTDLEAESIDILDIRFRIEQAFGFKISDDDVMRHIGEDLSAEEIQEQFTVESLVEYVKERLAEKETV